MKTLCLCPSSYVNLKMPVLRVRPKTGAMLRRPEYPEDPSGVWTKMCGQRALVTRRCFSLKTIETPAMVSRRALSPRSRVRFGRYMRIEGSCARSQGILERHRLTGAEPREDEEQQGLKCVSQDAHKLLVYKELCWLSLLQPTGTESAQPFLLIG